MAKDYGMAEFQAALDDLVYGSSRAPTAAGRSPAHINPPIVFDPETGTAYSDAPKKKARKAEMQRWKERQERIAASQAKKKEAPARKPRAAAAPKPDAKKWKPEDPNGPLTYRRARVVGKALGGLGAYCPTALAAGASHEEALRGMGLSTAGQAHDFLKACKKAKCLPDSEVRTTHAGKEYLRWSLNSPANARKAREILETQFRVSCPVDGSAKPAKAGKSKKPKKPKSSKALWKEKAVAVAEPRALGVEVALSFNAALKRGRTPEQAYRDALWDWDIPVPRSAASNPRRRR